MIKLNSIPYNPSEHEQWLLEMLFGGKTQVEMAVMLDKPDYIVRKQVDRLRLRLGAASNAQMIGHYGQYKARLKDAAQGTVRPTALLQCPEMQHCLDCPKGNPVRQLKKYVEDICER